MEKVNITGYCVPGVTLPIPLDDAPPPAEGIGLAVCVLNLMNFEVAHRLSPDVGLTWYPSGSHPGAGPHNPETGTAPHLLAQVKGGSRLSDDPEWQL